MWCLLLGQVELVEVVSSEGSSTLGTLSKTRVIATPNALRAEDMETLGKDSIFFTGTAARAVQLGLGRGGEGRGGEGRGGEGREGEGRGGEGRGGEGRGGMGRGGEGRGGEGTGGRKRNIILLYMIII